jgi:hypothetical protein
MCTKEEWLAAVERDDNATLAEAKREVATLFTAISGRLGEDAARRLFARVTARPEGRPRKRELCLIDRILLGCNAYHGRRKGSTLAYQMGFGQSVEANEKRLQRLLKELRT